jgi:hypothetical protein
MGGLDPVSSYAPTAQTNPKRAAVVAEMRAEAEAADSMPFPDPYQTEQSARLATRSEPRSVQDVRIVEAELSDIAVRRARTTDPHEIALLNARARELRRLALASESLRP